MSNRIGVLVKALIGGDATAVNPLYDELYGTRDPRLAEFNRAVANAYYGRNRRDVADELIGIFAVEVLEEEGVSLLSVMENVFDKKKKQSLEAQINMMLSGVMSSLSGEVVTNG